MGTEAEFLAQQREEARLAMRQTVRDIGTSLEKLVTEHPLLALGGAAVAGALAARIAAPSNRRQQAAPPADGAGKSSLMTMIENSVLNLVKAGLEGFVVNAVTTRQSKADAKDDGESHET